MVAFLSNFIEMPIISKIFPDKNYCLGVDLDFTGVSYVPIQDVSGSFDGQGHRISNLKLNSNQANVGLFASASGKEVVKCRGNALAEVSKNYSFSKTTWIFWG